MRDSWALCSWSDNTHKYSWVRDTSLAKKLCVSGCSSISLACRRQRVALHVESGPASFSSHFQPFHLPSFCGLPWTPLCCSLILSGLLEMGLHGSGNRNGIQLSISPPLLHPAPAGILPTLKLVSVLHLSAQKLRAPSRRPPWTAPFNLWG